MILADTSVWINHFRNGLSHLQTLLIEANISCHPFIIGELACENLKNRKEILSLLKDLPVVPVADHEEYLYFVEHSKLMGTGIGFADIHLLAASCISGDSIWTLDRKLKIAAEKLKIAYIP